MILISLILGFHPLFLPTFLIELFPIVDMVPTWTGCVGAVVLLRKRVSQPPVEGEPPATQTPEQKASAPSGPIIDV